ncbi:hypothetical protein I6A84_18430 [Frankia sp. CNm7]|uniref:Uncharacterized protein n=1 Tax=Frankia nepalensis TaxID=1836974 RepID=A0A937RA51_9ACTN|nr:hypothetical protein [Frankia nepalensis]MBL7502392.1 hypothetical protein [Frankia nepalensis]MBL7515900.1 hypothetical protein [Frankia nepalensis]MBL7520017.1 hypothetical protein [Frankia nepalensis]MBL7625947.1 hypothetical protein [Frankia nepalensis]
MTTTSEPTPTDAVPAGRPTTVPTDPDAPVAWAEPDEAYSRLPSVGPYPVEIGSALITMVEPRPGHERAYNRWYEDDHFYGGAMAMPWMFTGRRWVAPRELQLLRRPLDSVIAQPVTLGPYIAVYWITKGRQEDHMRWTVATNQRLLPDGRVYLDRDHVFTAFQRYLGVSYRDAPSPDGPARPRDIHALDYPYQGLVVEVVDAPAEAAEPGGAGVAGVLDWLRAERAPRVLAVPGVAMGLYFTPLPLPENRMSYVKQVEGLDRRVTVLWFLEADPRSVWEDAFAGAAEQAAAGGAGRLELVAPFLPTIPGTDAYVDELR